MNYGYVFLFYIVWYKYVGEDEKIVYGSGYVGDYTIIKPVSFTHVLNVLVVGSGFNCLLGQRD